MMTMNWNKINVNVINKFINDYELERHPTSLIPE